VTATAPRPTSPVAPPSPVRDHRFHPLRVSRLDRLTDDAVAITFEVPEPLRELYRFIAGQHVALRCTIAGDDVRRNYSIAAPESSGELRIGVRRLPGGVFSGYACERLRVGDTIEVMPPAGRFTLPLDPLHAEHYVAITGGSGITPVLSLAATALEVEPGSRFTILLANRTSRSIMFLDELEDLRDRHLGRLDLLHVLDGETREVELLSGTLDPARLGRILDLLLPPDGVDVWLLCGPAGLVGSARDTLLGRGVDPARVHRELFIASAPPPAAAVPAVPPNELHDHEQPPPGRDHAIRGDHAIRSATVRLDGRTSTVEVPDGITVLDALLRIRPDAPYACRGGVCGTCRARLLEGTAEMPVNYALEPPEVDAGYVLACQSRPTSPRVTLDFDA
jgi:ring-1,2-phenylacetyl-CoA epoxidase subunit PaaE